MPFITRTYVTAPRYSSYTESNTIACSVAFGSPVGGGTRSITAASNSSQPMPDLPLQRSTSSGVDRQRVLHLFEHFVDARVR